MPGQVPDPALKALTDWWADMGVAADPAFLKALSRPPVRPAPAAAGAADAPVPVARSRPAPIGERIEAARSLAAGCTSIAALAEAIASFDGCPLKASSRSTVVLDGPVDAPVMVIGEGPGAEEDRQGKPFVGKAGQLLDRMLAAIGLSRETNALITNVNYWRPPNNRNPEDEELAVCRPFVDRMVDLAAPRLIIAAGAVPAGSLLGTDTGIMRLRGSERVFTTPGGLSVPLFPILHPAFLLRRPLEKSRAWRDLMLIEARARELGALPPA